MPRAPRSCSRFARALVYRAGPAYPPVLQAIQPVSARFKVSRSGLGDFAFSLPLPSLRHVAQVPVAPLAPDIQAVLQEPFRTT